MKKFISLLLTGTVLLSTLTACSDNNTSPQATPENNNAAQATAPAPSQGSEAAGTDSNLTAPGELPIVKEKVTLKVTTVDHTNIGPYEQTDFTKWFEEQTNVHIEYTEIPGDALKEKVNLNLVSGDLPDVYLSCDISNAQQVQYGPRGTFLALNDLIETQGVEFKKVQEEVPLMSKIITAPDGNIYALPQVNDCFHCKYRRRSWINQEWLNAVNMEVPNTTEEFEAVLQAFKDGDPNGNGKADEYPMMGSTNDGNLLIPVLMQAFTFTSDTYLDDNQQVMFGPIMDEYKEGLIWIRNLIAKGLIDPTSLTQSNDQFRAVLATPDAITVGVPVSFNLPGDMGNDPERIKEYVPLPPLEGPNGVRGMESKGDAQIVYTGKFVITDKCENPEVAFRWADAWYSKEASMTAWCGLEGVTWEKPDGGIGLNGEPAVWKDLQMDGTKTMDPNQLSTMTNLFGYNSASIRESLLFDESDPNAPYKTEPFLHFACRDVFSKYAKPDNTLPPLFQLEDEATEYANLLTQITDYVNEQTTLFLLGEKDIEKDWDSYIAEYKNLNLERYLEMVQESYDRQYR